MNWLRKLFDRGQRDFRTRDFHVRIEPVFREVISVIYTRNGTTINFSGELIGRKWNAIEIQIPQDIDSERATQIAADLASAFRDMDYGFIIARKLGVGEVPQSEREAALAELHKMGYEIEILADGRIRQSKKKDAPCQDIETLRKTTPRMMSLIRTLHGRRARFEVLAKSSEFQDSSEFV